MVTAGLPSLLLSHSNTDANANAKGPIIDAEEVVRCSAGLNRDSSLENEKENK